MKLPEETLNHLVKCHTSCSKLGIDMTWWLHFMEVQPRFNLQDVAAFQAKGHVEVVNMLILFFMLCTDLLKFIVVDMR